MKRIKVAVNTNKFGGSVDIIDNACRERVNNLPLIELDLDQDPMCFDLFLSGVNLHDL